jgi:hypothetical protein
VTSDEDEQAPEGAPFTRQDLFSLLGALGALLTLATATMYYFGWRRSDVQARAMEMDVTMFGFSTQDYVLRGISSLYAPLLVLGVLVIGWLGAHRLVLRALASPRLQGRRRTRVLTGLRWTSVIAATIAIACVLYTWEGAGAAPRWPVPAVSRAIGTWRWTVPALLVVATLTALYASWIHRHLTRDRSRPPTWSTALVGVVVVGAVALGLFWVLEDYAGTIGRRNAELLAQQVMTMPRASVISPTALHIEADGVTEEEIEGGAFKTTGLRLLARSGGKMILLHDGWSPRTGTVIIVADSDELLWQLTR